MSVQIGAISATLSSFLSQNDYSHIAVIVDEKTQKHCLPLIQSLLPKNYTKIVIKSG